MKKPNSIFRFAIDTQIFLKYYPDEENSDKVAEILEQIDISVTYLREMILIKSSPLIIPKASLFSSFKKCLFSETKKSASTHSVKAAMETSPFFSPFF